MDAGGVGERLVGTRWQILISSIRWVGQRVRFRKCCGLVFFRNRGQRRSLSTMSRGERRRWGAGVFADGEDWRRSVWNAMLLCSLGSRIYDVVVWARRKFVRAHELRGEPIGHEFDGIAIWLWNQVHGLDKIKVNNVSKSRWDRDLLEKRRPSDFELGNCCAT